MSANQQRQETIFLPPLAVMIFIGFVLGLMMSYWFAGLFGLSPPLFWAAFVIVFVIGVFFLAYPKLYLVGMFIYYGFFLDGWIIGHYHIGIPFVKVLDELMLAIPLAIIAMRAVDRSLPRGATLFPLLYALIVVLSYKVNEVPTSLALRVSLSYFKFYIYWYFARAIGPWSDKEKRFWFVGFVIYGLIQFGLNIVWHRGPFLRHPDLGSGSIGDAHFVGYLSAYALFFVLGWYLSLQNRRTSLNVMLFAGGCAFLIAYNMVFLTDSKHLLFLLPIAGAPFLLHPRFEFRWRFAVVIAGTMLLAASALYLVKSGQVRTYSPRDYYRTVKYSGKGKVFNAIVKRLPEELPMPLFGAGPGNFCSSAAVRAWRPLAVKYYTPHIIRAFRHRGQAAESSVVGNPRTSYFVLLGEFGPVVFLSYIGFWAYVVITLWKRSVAREPFNFQSSQELALVSCICLIALLGGLIDVFSIGILMIPIWTLVGIHWDLPPSQEDKDAQKKKLSRLPNRLLPS